MIEVTIRGSAELRKVAALLREEHKALQRNVNQGTRKAVRPLERQIRAGVPAYMPSGYAPVLARALRVTTSIRAAGVTMRVRAMGKREERDVDARNRGSLRHPVFGRRKQKWAEQLIRAGFVDNPARDLADDVYRELDAVAERVRERVERG